MVFSAMRSCFWLTPVVLAATLGCASPHRADQGALIGGLIGAGTGALIGESSGNAAAGAALGAGVGALTGAVVGSEIDEAEARNRALIEAQMGRRIRTGAVTIDDVVMMTHSGVDEELIANHVRSNGAARMPSAADLVYLNEQGVSKRVVMAMQEPPPVRQTETVVVERPSRPVVVHEYHYRDPFWHPPVRHCYHPRHRHSSVHWGVSFGH